MTRKPYSNAIWLRTDSTGLMIGFGDAWLYFEDPREAILQIDQLLTKVKEAVPLEDLTPEMSLATNPNDLINMLNQQYGLFCTGQEASIRMSRMAIHANTVLYKECGDDDEVIRETKRKTSPVYLRKDCFPYEPPKLISLRISESRPMKPGDHYEN